MKSAVILFCLPVILSLENNPNQKQILKFAQLRQPVEIITDLWGVPHIYAKNEQDLFFAQGYQAAKDRLFQFEIFRRRATGTMAEVLGKRELKRDIGARLFRFRGDVDTELSHYHPRGKAIIQSFVDGINAYISQVLDGRMPLPFELRMLGIKPGYWTTETVISRHNGLLGNVQEELKTARLIIKFGEDVVRTISNFWPSPDLTIDPSINTSGLQEDVLSLYNAFRTAVSFTPDDVVAGFPGESDISAISILNQVQTASSVLEGSNNWVINGEKSKSGFPIMANDPHRSITVPSLRYIVHLSAPGWNVIGGGEPILPGVSIGHNEHGAWGLTIFETDAEDLYIYHLNPANPLQYFYKGEWKQFITITDTIAVENERDEIVKLYYSVHGPVTHIDSSRHIAYAVKCGWLETGSAPYLASLRMNQARSWEEFRDACAYSYIPAENMVWADRKGNIGWQSVGIAPIRNHHSGMVPVPGDGQYEWDGYLPVLKRPYLTNPVAGFLNTANEYNTPENYPFMNSIGFEWADSYRSERIKEVLRANKKFTVADMQELQADYLSLPARTIVPLLLNITATDDKLLKAKSIFSGWDYTLSPTSLAASVYSEWERQITKNLLRKLNLDSILNHVSSFSIQKIISLLQPGKNRAVKSERERDELFMESLQDAMINLEKKLGIDTANWQYGQINMKHILIRHPLAAISGKTKQLNIGPVPRGGDANTVNSTGINLSQGSGASFRIIIDCADWDLATAINTPGQSADPENKHYRDLFSLWRENKYFPLYYSEKKVRTAAEHILQLLPDQK